MQQGPIIIQAGGGADWVALAALFVSIASGIFTVWWSFWSTRRSYVEGYWFREVTAPSCIEPAMEIRQNWCKRIESLSNTKLTPDGMRLFMGELQADVDAAINKAWISKLFEGDLYAAIVRRLEDISDIVADELEVPVRSDQTVSSLIAVRASEAVSSNVLWVVKRAAAANGAGLKIAKADI